MHPPYYRSCWHGVSRCFLFRYTQKNLLFTDLPCSLTTGLYNPKAFIVHAASLHQAFAHCEIFSTAASRRSLGSVSVPVLAVNLSIRLGVLALVSHYLTNELIPHELHSYRKASFKVPHFDTQVMPLGIAFGISGRFQPLSPGKRQIIHVLLTLSPLREDYSSLRATCMSHPRRQRSV